MDELAQAFAQVFTPGSELSKIILVTLQMAACSTVISTVIGVPLGTLIGLYRFRGKRILMRILLRFCILFRNTRFRTDQGIFTLTFIEMCKDRAISVYQPEILQSDRTDRAGGVSKNNRVDLRPLQNLMYDRPGV